MRTTIKKIGINGEGIGYIDHTPVFIEGALLHEIVDIKIVEKNPRYMIAKIEKIIKKSEFRVIPKCQIQYRCKTCSMMEIAYEQQKEYKYDLLKQTLIKYAQVDPRLVKRTVGCQALYAYRSQSKFFFASDEQTGELAMGLYKGGSNFFIPINKCIVVDDRIERISIAMLNIFKKHRLYPYHTGKKTGLRSLSIRMFEEEAQCILVSGKQDLSPEIIQEIMNIPNVTSLWQSIQLQKRSSEIGGRMILLAGEKQQHFEFLNHSYQLSPKSFFYINKMQAEVLYTKVKEMVEDEQDYIVHAYSNIGILDVILKDKAKKIVGITPIKDEMIDAKVNIAANHINNIDFICSEDIADKFAYLAKKEAISTLIMESPRSGSQELCVELLKGKIKNVIYISCNPATLGKDLHILNEKYIVDTVIPIDMMPQTSNLQIIVKLKRK